MALGRCIHACFHYYIASDVSTAPECKIGLYPDVGGSWWIPRLKLYSQWKNKSVVGGVGNYLALTGAKLKADDLIYAGIATHYVKSNRLEELKRCLVAATEDDDSSKLGAMGDCAASVLTSFHDDDIDWEASFLSQNRLDIDYAFDGKESVEEILDSLESMGPDSKFGTSTLSVLKTMSPTSLKVTLEGLKRGAKAQTIEEALQMEYRIVMHMMEGGSDFYEGIRAALVDKDGSPKWSPENLIDVTEEMVNRHFEELEDELNFTGENCK